MDIVHHGIQGQRPPMSRKPSFGTRGAKHRDVKPETETLVGAPLPAPFPEVSSEESLGVGELGFQFQAMSLTSCVTSGGSVYLLDLSSLTYKL